MKIDKAPQTNDLALNEWLEKLHAKLIEDDIVGSDTWDPASIANGAKASTAVTVTGAKITDYATASFSLDLTGLVLDAEVTAANTVTCVLANNTGGAVDLGSGTIYVRVYRRTT